MYEILKIKLICMVVDGCNFDQWNMFNKWCKTKLTKREFSNIKKISEYKRLFNYFGEI